MRTRTPLRESPTLYAHRGASFELPENTLESFRLAIELGATALETDAHMTRDGHVVLSHDPTGLRMAGVPSRIRDVTLTEAQTWNMGAKFVRRGAAAADERRVAESSYRIPTLEEALRQFPDVVFNVDAKQVVPDMVPSLVRAIRRVGAENRVRIASFSVQNLRRVRRAGYEGETGLAAPELAALMLSPASVTRTLALGDAAQVPERAYGFTFASPWAIDRLHSRGVRVDFWTIDDADEARRLLAMGADGIMTDDVRSVASAFRSL